MHTEMDSMVNVYSNSFVYPAAASAQTKLNKV